MAMYQVWFGFAMSKCKSNFILHGICVIIRTSKVKFVSNIMRAGQGLAALRDTVLAKLYICELRTEGGCSATAT